MIKPLIFSLFRENQHATARETRAAPATLAIITLIVSVKGDPSKSLMTMDGMVNNAKPVTPSKNEVAISNPFEDPNLDSIYLA